MTSVSKNLAFNEAQRLDLYLVDEPDRPLVVCVHGGGFISGAKDDKRCLQSISLLNDAGFNCASITYSLAPEEDRFAMWPQNLMDLADSLSFLHANADRFSYNFNRLGLMGFSAGCCLCNLYIQGGSNIFEHFDYQTQLFNPRALVGFYGPYDFSSRQPERRSEDPDVNLHISPSYWLKQSAALGTTAVFHVHGDRDETVRPDQHHKFEQDYKDRGYDFKGILVEDFGHSFAPRDTNETGKTIDLQAEISAFLSQYL